MRIAYVYNCSSVSGVLVLYLGLMFLVVLHSFQAL